jgi:hypothetical protein
VCAAAQSASTVQLVLQVEDVAQTKPPGQAAVMVLHDPVPLHAPACVS